MKKLNFLVIALLAVLASDVSAITIYNIKCKDDCGEVKTIDGMGFHYVRCRGKRDLRCPVRLGTGPGGGVIIDLSGQIALTSDEVEKNLLQQVQDAINSGHVKGKIIPVANGQKSEEAVRTVSMHADRMLEFADSKPQALEGMTDKHHFAVWNISPEGHFTIIVD